MSHNPYDIGLIIGTITCDDRVFESLANGPGSFDDLGIRERHLPGLLKRVVGNFARRITQPAVRPYTSEHFVVVCDDDIINECVTYLGDPGGIYHLTAHLDLDSATVLLAVRLHDGGAITAALLNETLRGLLYDFDLETPYT